MSFCSSCLGNQKRSTVHGFFKEIFVYINELWKALFWFLPEGNSQSVIFEDLRGEQTISR